ncbi:hypothetical protein HYALB_00013604 [Hymenoscyphus albidus]|uniref:Uncharacterized protein n=1 Tax=Hymenoscyphus albidus TaxID=595503 RepID=A0A9N9LRU0_9HELO|nr:hypothetical protein HYALB_00013604 [Hymenoscyphus albidus]
MQKGGKYVTASLLIWKDGESKLLIARNMGFEHWQEKHEEEFRDFLQARLRKIALEYELCHRNTENIDRLESTPWRIMIQYYKPRLMWYRAELFKLTSVQLSGSTDTDEDDLQGRMKKFGEDLEDLKRSEDDSTWIPVIKEAHDMYVEFDEAQFLRLYRTNAYKVRRLVGFIGRPHECWLVLIRSAKIFHLQFRDIEIQFLPPPDEKQDAGKLGLPEMLRLFNFPSATDNKASCLGVEATRLINGLMENKNGKIPLEAYSDQELCRKFTNHQKAELQVHAEIQILSEISKPKYKLWEDGGFIGCSKYSCHTCWLFLTSHYRKYRMGGHHRRLYSWMIPKNSLDLEGFSTALSSTHTSVLNEVSRIFGNHDAEPNNYDDTASQSTIGSIFSRQSSMENFSYAGNDTEHGLEGLSSYASEETDASYQQIPSESQNSDEFEEKTSDSESDKSWWLVHPGGDDFKEHVK